MRGLLIGNPVDKSISHLTHPVIFQKHGLNASYEKRLIPSAEEIVALKSEKFHWIAVTMPHKEHVLSFIDSFDPHARAIGAVNMIHVVEGRWIGYNTDAAGCLNAIEKKCLVKGKNILILGAGGTAKAIAYEAKRRGAQVAIYNRTQEKAQKIAKDLGVEWVEIPNNYDILINATSVGMDNSRSLPIDLAHLLPHALVMDVVYYPRITTLLLEAANRGCDIVTGLEMFIELTFLQLQIVFGQIIQKEVVAEVIYGNSW